MAPNPALQQMLFSAAAKALGKDLDQLLPKTAVRKADPSRHYSDYDLSLGQFHVPGRTRPEDPSEEHRLLAGLKMMSQKLRAENEALRKEVVREREQARETALREGYDKGHRDGMARGKTEAAKAAGEVRRQMACVIGKFAAQQDALLARAERKTVEIILQCVSHILDKEASASPDLVLSVVRRALAEVARAETVTIKVNPADFAPVSSGRDFWLPVNKRINGVKIVDDARVPRGGCILETPAGGVDARLSVQLDNLRDIFLKCWEEGAEGNA